MIVYLSDLHFEVLMRAYISVYIRMYMTPFKNAASMFASNDMVNKI